MGNMRASQPAATRSLDCAAITRAAQVASPKEPNRSAPMPATSPTLSPTLSAMVAGLRGSSSGMPASDAKSGRSAPGETVRVTRCEYLAVRVDLGYVNTQRFDSCGARKSVYREPAALCSALCPTPVGPDGKDDWVNDWVPV
eukprot:4467439-Pyramimonas_sp.AAC.1